MRNSWFVLILFIGAAPLIAQEKKEVLFIGNSYTGVNNLPKLIQDLALSVGDTLIYDSHTPGGARLLSHAGSAVAISKIYAKKWDHVVFQAQSQEPSWNDGQVATEVFPYAKILCDTVYQNDSCTRPMFYMTWGRENGDATNCATAPWVCTYEGMDSVLNKNYRQMGVDNDAIVSPVGAVWRFIRVNHPAIQLYSADGSHPSAAGSYAAACTFYSMLFEKDPNLISFNFGLTSSIADSIKNAVKTIAFDSLVIWNVDTTSPQSMFAVSANTPALTYCEFSFFNQSVGGCQYEWDFGDGTPNEYGFHVSHKYVANGGYNVSLKVSKAGSSVIDSSAQFINVSCGFSLDENRLVKDLKVYPNPSRGRIAFESKDLRLMDSFKIIDSQGRIVLTRKTNGLSEFDLKELNPGYYMMTADFSDGRVGRVRLGLL